MNSIREKKDQIVNFWSIDEESDREKLIEEIKIAYKKMEKK